MDQSPFAETVNIGLIEATRLTEDVPPTGAQRYALRATLGEGGMGRVLTAEDRQFSRLVAVKQLRHELTGAGARDRFMLEALVTGNLEHPGVPTVYEHGTNADGTAFYAMRLVQGRTLADAIDEATSLEARLKLIPAIVRVAQTLGFAHERGVVHRDVKPENVIVGRHGETVLLDWGIAKVRGVSLGDSGDGAPLAVRALRSGATAHGSVLGTPAYMAPEQAEGKVDAIDERTDVFAVGALIYHLFAGHGPYAAATLANVIERATKAEFEPLETAAPDAPQGIRAICAKAMARAQGDRYQTANELADALESFAAHALTARESTALKHFATLATLGALGVLVFSAAFVFGQVSTFRDQGPLVFVIPFLAAVGIVFSGIEWRTRGRYALGPLSVALMLAVLFVGIAATVAGVEATLRTAASGKFTGVPFGEVVAEGVYESLGTLGVAALLAAVQAMFWGGARRRVLTRPSA